MNIELNNINKSFGDNHVLKNISFTAKSGAAFGLLGRNGSGKTTIIRLIMDIFKPDSGNIFFNGKPKSDVNYKIGYLPEERGLYPKKSILDQMVYFGELRGLTKVKAKERTLMLLEKVDAKDYIKRKLETLSKGNQQKIQLAIALINDPDILVLDEPFSGLDPVNSKLLKDLVNEEVQKGKLILFSSHQMASVEQFCDDICIINNGNIALNGSLSEIKKSYSRDKIYIVPSDNSDNTLKQTVNGNITIKRLIKAVNKQKDGYMFTLVDKNYKNEFINLLMRENVELDSFAVAEPTLEEIFVEKAGDIIE